MSGYITDDESLSIGPTQLSNINMSSYHQFLGILFLVAAILSEPVTTQAQLIDWEQVSPNGPPATERLSATAPLLQALIDLESNNDAKCHSTACRFENYLFGTPLDDDARSKRFELQKELAHWLWAASAADALSKKEVRISADRIAKRVDQTFKSIRSTTGMTVEFATGTTVSISNTRLRQYSSISYSLRAILGVQQDFLASGGPTLVSLENAAVKDLENAVNIATLCALMKADELSRQQNSNLVSATIFEQAWRQLVPEPVSKMLPTTSQAAGHSRKLARNLLVGIIRAKRNAYGKYNKLSDQDRAQLSFHNIRRFYARYAVPTEEQELNRFQRTFLTSVVRFAGSLLVESDRLASGNGQSIARTDEAVAAVQKLMPHFVDDFEDVHLFHRLSDEKVVLESYDCDSLRDFGMHWMHIGRALRNRPDIQAIPDPFAAEVIAEAVSQYTVLILRLAGQRAKELSNSRYMTANDVLFARDQIIRLAQKHWATEESVEMENSISSAPSPSRSNGESVYFSDATKSSGINYVHRSSSWLSQFRRREAQSPPTFSGGGIAAEDFDGDGHMDLLFLGGTGISVFSGDGQGKFKDESEIAKLDLIRTDHSFGEARQPLIADFDNDGKPDILITYANDSHQIFQNQGDFRFANRSMDCGLGGQGLIGGPATVFDFDNDGLLDVYICYFGDYLNGANPNHGHDSTNALPNKLFRNTGNFKFKDVSAESGTENTGWAQAVSHTDFDRDGLQDIIVANDFGRNAFLRNLGTGKFRNLAQDLGVTKFYHSMNVGITDLNADGFPDVYVSNIGTMVKDNKYVMPNKDTPLNFSSEAMAAMLIKEANMLYMSQANQGELASYSPSKQIVRGTSSTGWAWDAEFFDFDNDGDDDLYVVNGNNDYNMFSRVLPGDLFVDPQTGKKMKNKIVMEQLNQTKNVFYINEDSALQNRSAASGTDFAGNSRSTAYLDFDGDGDLDIAVNNFHAPATMLQNNSQTRKNNWIKIRLIGNPEKRCNRDAIGARIETELDNGQKILREIQGGSGYLSMNPKEACFGLGQQQEVDVRIIWPNGDHQNVEGLAANQRHQIQQQ